MKKLFVLTLLLATFVLLNTIQKVSAEIIITNVITKTFNYDMEVGSEGQDVYNLQRFLNAEEDTAIAFSGVGSRGYESKYFGELTKKAVIKFQTKNWIVPADGYVGQATRNLINDLYPKTNLNKPYPQKPQATQPSPSNEINLCQFVELMISVGAITPEKAVQARNVVNSQNPNLNCITPSSGVATVATTTRPDFSVNMPSFNYTTPTYNFDYLNGTNLGWGSSGNTYNYNYPSGIGTMPNMPSTFEGGKNLGKLRSYAVFAGGSLTNINNPSGAGDRTSITGDVSALTEQAVPLKITGKNTYDTMGFNQELASALDTAISSAKNLPCTYNISANNSDFGGKTLQPGVYCSSEDIKITGTLTLGESGKYIFKTTKNLLTYNTASSSSQKNISVKYTKENKGFDPNTGQPPYSVFWIVDGNVKIAQNSVFLGTVMSKAGTIEVGELTDIPEGRLLTPKSISLNKNTIITPPDPVKITVETTGDGSGKIIAPDFVCNHTRGDATCQNYYVKAGDTVTITAEDLQFKDPRIFGNWIETRPQWMEGCGLSSSNSKSCTIKATEDQKLKVKFELDTFGGFVTAVTICPNFPGVIYQIAGEHGGHYVSDKASLGGFVRGTLRDDQTFRCIGDLGALIGTYRVVKDLKQGLEN